MKIATWNVNSVRARLEHVNDWLSNNPVEVLCLQETKVTDQDFPIAPFEALGYHLSISGQKSYNGVAIFSRSPLQDLSCGFSPIVDTPIAQELDQQKRVITGMIGDIRIVNLYVPNGASLTDKKYEYKLIWLTVLRDYLQYFRDRNHQELCVCGDFNIALEDRDIYKPKGKENHIMSSPAEREALNAVLQTNQLNDVFRKFTEDTGHFSWWDYRQGGFIRNRGWRIDHHYLTPKLYEQAVGCEIDVEPRTREKPSDHTPVIVELSF